MLHRRYEIGNAVYVIEQEPFNLVYLEGLSKKYRNGKIRANKFLLVKTVNGEVVNRKWFDQFPNAREEMLNRLESHGINRRSATRALWHPGGNRAHRIHPRPREEPLEVGNLGVESLPTPDVLPPTGIDYSRTFEVEEKQSRWNRLRKGAKNLWKKLTGKK